MLGIGCRLGSGKGPRTLTAATSVELSLGSLNLRCGRNRAGEPYAISPAIQTLSTDIVVVQENWRPDGSDSIARRAAADCGYTDVVELDVLRGTSLYDLGVVTDIAASENGDWGLAVLSRVPIIRNENVWLGLASGDVGPRAAQIADIGSGGEAVVRVVNVHLTHRLLHGPSQLRCLMKAIDAGHLPTAIAGDLNMCRPTISLARPYRPAIRGRTWPARRPVAQIDHVLVGQGIDVLARQVILPVGSDHLPVRVAMRVTRTHTECSRDKGV